MIKDQNKDWNEISFLKKNVTVEGFSNEERTLVQWKKRQLQSTNM